MAQFGGDGFCRNGLAGTDDFRRRVDVGGVAEDWTAEALDDDAIVFDVEIRKDAHYQDRQSEKDDQDGADDRVSGQHAVALCRSGSFRDLEFDSHVTRAESPRLRG